MKIWYAVIFFYFFFIDAFAQNINLTVSADGQPTLGASISINGKVKAIADEQGKAQLTNIQSGDTIRISYIGYQSEQIVVSPQQKTVNVNLNPMNFNIGEVHVSQNNDRRLFRKMMKDGLKDVVLYEENLFRIIDTLNFFSVSGEIYRECTGSFTAPERGMAIKIKKSQTRLLKSTSEEGKKFYLSQIENGKTESDLFGCYKVPNYIRCREVECRDIGICFTMLYALTNINHNLRFIYLGKDSANYDLFYYYVPDGKWIHNSFKTKSYTGGIVYLNAAGVIEKIKDHKTALNAYERSYEMDIDYFYDKKYNELVPYNVAIKNYFLDENLNVQVTRSARLEIYSKQAVEAGVVIPKQ